MGQLDFEALERGCKGVSAEPTPRLTPELLGRMIVWAYRLYHPEDDFGNPDEMFSVLVSSENELPASIAKTIHIDHRIDGNFVLEETRLMTGSQSSQSIGRLNPDTRTPVFKIDPVQASHLLGIYQCQFPEEVDWIKASMRKFSSEATQANGVAA